MLSALNALRNLDLQRELNSNTPQTSQSGVSSTSSASSISTTSSQLNSTLDSSTDDSTSSLSKDTVNLLKDLAKGNITAAKTDVARLQKDLKSGDSSENHGLSTLLSNISKSLDAGSASDALSSLASYLIQTGNSTGSLIDTSA